MPNNAYKKLPGRKVSLAGYSRLYEAHDHILSVKCIGVTEHYKRFYYKDIQAIISHKTFGSMIRNIVSIVIALGLMGIALAIGEEEAYWIFGLPAALFVIFLAINIARGPSCKTYILTAVQTEELPSLRQWRAARRVAGRLKPLIEAAQGPIDPELLEAKSIQRMQFPESRKNAPTAPK